jgi:hypothetical protein
MFSAADLWQQQQIATSVEAAGYATYLPQRDGIEVGKVMATVSSVVDPAVLAVMQFVREIVFAMDIFQLTSRCQSLVFNMDGRVPDDGSVVEVAAGFAIGRPIVIFKTTPITMLGGMDNPMVSGLAMNWQTAADPTALPQAIAAAVSTMGDDSYTPAKHLLNVNTLGSAVWDAMPATRAAIDSGTPQAMIDYALKFKAQLEPLLQAAFPGAPG